MSNTESEGSSEKIPDISSFLEERKSIEQKKSLPLLDVKTRIRQVIEAPYIEKLLDNIDKRINAIINAVYVSDENMSLLEKIYDECAELAKRKKREDVLPRLKEISKELTKVEQDIG